MTSFWCELLLTSQLRPALCSCLLLHRRCIYLATVMCHVAWLFPFSIYCLCFLVVCGTQERFVQRLTDLQAKRQSVLGQVSHASCQWKYPVVHAIAFSCSIGHWFPLTKSPSVHCIPCSVLSRSLLSSLPHAAPSESLTLSESGR